MAFGLDKIFTLFGSLAGSILGSALGGSADDSLFNMEARQRRKEAMEMSEQLAAELESQGISGETLGEVRKRPIAEANDAISMARRALATRQRAGTGLGLIDTLTGLLKGDFFKDIFK